jgi:VIT1/CCC1 family predicted Fe2+/Mn2+ transporter
MPQTPHVESHFTASEAVRDIVIGMSDGLTVPFALAAGLSGAVASSHIIVTAGLAEVAAGAIAMGLGGYLAAKSDADHYESERQREIDEVSYMPEEERAEVRDVFRNYGLTDQEIAPILHRLAERPTDWINFMMRFELGIEKPDPKRALTSALTIAGAYIAGGIIPLAPYMVLKGSGAALSLSVLVTIIALFAFGFCKGRFTGVKPWKAGMQTVFIGGLAAAAAFAIAKMVSGAS